MPRIVHPVKSEWSIEDVLAALNAAGSEEAQTLVAFIKETHPSKLPPWTIGQHAEIGNTLMSLRFFDAAARVFEAIRSRWPGDALGWRGGALLAAQLGEWVQCANFWERCLSCSAPETHQSWWLSSYADALLRSGQVELASDVYDKLRSHWPNDSGGWRGGAQIAAQQGNWSTAGRFWRECLERTPEEAQPQWCWASFAEALAKQEDFSAAAAAYETIRARWPNTPVGWHGGAQVAARQGNWAAAAEFWRESLVRVPEEAQPHWCWASLAEALTKQGDLDAAAAVYQTIRLRWPDDTLGWRGGALLAMQASRWEEAAILWQRCLGSFPVEGQLSWWWASYAATMVHLGRHEEAAEVYEKLRTQWPLDLAGWQGGASLIEKTRGWRRAVRDLAGWAQAARQSQSPECHAEYVLALLRAGERERAGREVEAILTSFARDARIVKLLTDVARLTGDPRGALSQLLNLPPSTSFESCPPEQLAQLLYDAGLNRAEASRLLFHWLGPENGEDALNALYAVRRVGNTDLNDLVKRHQTGKRSFATRVQLREIWHKFLRDRSYPYFETLVSAAMEVGDRAELLKLARVAKVRFPNSRLALQLKCLVTEGSLPLSEEDNAFAYRWRNTLPETDYLIASQLSGRPWRRLVCAMVIRDEDEMLADVIVHYRDIGVNSFIIVDNGSQNDPAGLLNKIPDVEITLVRAEGEFGPARHGMYWVNEILETGCCDWLLFVDCDEFLVFPGDSEKCLLQLLDHLDARGETAMFAVMADVFDAGFAVGGEISAQIEEHNLLLADMRFQPSLQPPWISVSGGVRGLQEYVFKTPLIKASAGVRYINNHIVTQCRRAETSGALIHYKVFRDRVLFAADMQDVAVHSRVRHRGRACVSRHLAMTQLRPAKGVEQSFQVDASPQRLLALGYMSADPDWKAQLSEKLPANRLMVAKHVHDRLLREMPTRPSLTLSDMSFGDILKQLAQATSFVSRQDFRFLLNAHLVRIGRREVRLAIVLYSAQLLGRTSAMERLLQKLLASIKRSPAVECESALTAVAIAMGPHSPSALRLMEAVVSYGTPLRSAINTLASIQLKQGDFSGASKLLLRTDPLADEESVVLYLNGLRFQRDWDAYYSTIMAAFDKGRIRLRRHVLWLIHMFRDAHGRQEMLARFQLELSRQLPELEGEGLAAYLATLHLLGQYERFASIYRANEERLPRICRTFFSRLIASGTTKDPTNLAWCVGFSKTGTTSLHVFCNELGLASAHWMNPVLGRLLDEEDAELFDVVSDSTVTFLARRHGIPRGRKVIATTRDYESWSRSFMQHFQYNLAAPDASFETLKDICNFRQDLSWGPVWNEIHQELHFRFRSLAESYDYHHEWLRALRRDRGELFLEVPLGRDNESNARAVQRFLGVESRQLKYPHSNRTITF